MTHIQLVQAATDLLSETTEPQTWLAAYDAALASSSDRELAQLIHRLLEEVHPAHLIAA